MTGWTKGAWDGYRPVGLPDDELQFVWSVARLRFCWGHLNCTEAHSARLLLRSLSAYAEAMKEAPPDWYWRLCPDVPELPSFETQE